MSLYYVIVNSRYEGEFEPAQQIPCRLQDHDSTARTACEQSPPTQWRRFRCGSKLSLMKPFACGRRLICKPKSHYHPPPTWRSHKIQPTKLRDCTSGFIPLRRIHSKSSFLR